VAEILTEILQPGSVGDQRNVGFDKNLAFEVSSRGDLQDQASLGVRPLRGLDPGVHGYTRDE
jgi:hypothetical protein